MCFRLEFHATGSLAASNFNCSRISTVPTFGPAGYACYFDGDEKEHHFNMDITTTVL
jgi:hypothetical protein